MAKKLWKVEIRENYNDVYICYGNIKAETGIDAIETVFIKLGTKKTYKQWIQEHIDINASYVRISFDHENCENVDIDNIYRDENGESNTKNYWIGASSIDEQ